MTTHDGAVPPKRVLVVDDDAALRGTVRRALVGAGFVVEEAENGKAALEACRLRPPDLVILDIIMPEQEGLETIRQLRSGGTRVPIIAVSGGGIGSAEDYLDAARALGASRSLRKPFALGDLVSAVTEEFAS